MATSEPSPTAAPLDPDGNAAVAALGRALEVHDPAAARRAAVRAAVVAHLAEPLQLSDEVVAHAIAAALVAEVGNLVSRARMQTEDPAAAVLAAAVLDRLPGLDGPARTVRHLFEHWDGTGGPLGLAGEVIPYPSRLLAVVSSCVGPLDAGATPSWSVRAGRTRSFAGTVLDPALTALVVAALAEQPVDVTRATLDSALALLDRLSVVAGGATPVDTLRTITAAVTSVDRLDDVLGLIAEQTRRATGASRVGIGRVDADRALLCVLVNVGDLPAGTTPRPTAEVHPLESFPAFTAFTSGRDHLLSVEADPAGTDPVTRYLRDRDAVSEAAATVDVGGQRWGVVWVANRPGRPPLDETTLDTLRTVAGHVAATAAQVQRLTELEHLALRDPLTGLGNRRVLELTLREIFARPAIDRQDCAVIMCDVDELKVVNDTLGHAAGDKVLLDAAAALREATSPLSRSTVCRIGGDEYCVVIDGGGMLHAHAVAARAQEVFSRSGPSRSLSCGVAFARSAVETPSQLLRAADEAQYQEKRARKGLPPLPAGTIEPRGRRARRDR
jgi:diguanylate cyclase (GGDEF)-like protein